MSATATTSEATGEPQRLEREIEQLRDQLDELVDELDRRRHDAFDWRLQVSKHRGAVALGAAVLLAGVTLAIRRSRRPVSLADHVGTLARGLYALGNDPERVERAGPGRGALATELAKTAALAGASVLVRRYTRRALGEVD